MNHQTVCVDPRLKVGLSLEVAKILSGLDNVSAVSLERVARHRGVRKVNFPKRWTSSGFQIRVLDKDHGLRQLFVLTSKPGAIRRIAGVALRRNGILVEGL